MILRILRTSFLAGLLVVAGAGSAWGDVVQLKAGGQIEGELLTDSPSSSVYRVKLPGGGQVTLARSDVSQIRRARQHEAEYTRLARSTPDTVEEHERLAEWCRERKLVDASRAHLERVLELNPEHDLARRQLGYQHHQGRWLSRDELMAARGMVLYGGKYRTRQEVELIERKQKRELVEAEWNDRLRRWRRWLDDRDPARVAEAHQNLLAVRDPGAAPALIALLEQEQNRDVVFLLIQVAAQMRSAATIDALVQLSIYDNAEEIRDQCLEYLVDAKLPGLSAPYIRALRSSDNTIVNRAAIGLRALGDRESISPLVDALITEHRSVSGGGGTQGNHAYSMSSDGGFSFGGKAPRVERRQLKNPAVLSALVHLSGGASFGYDPAQWRTWQATQVQLAQSDLRRDP